MDDLDIRILIFKVSVVACVIFWIVSPYLSFEGIYSRKAYGGLISAIIMIVVIVIYLYVQIKNIGKKK